MGRTTELSDSRLANLAAQTIRDRWTSLADRFRIITRRAQARFEEQDWTGIAADHVERLDLYSAVCDDAEAAVRVLLEARVDDRNVWTGMKAVYSGLIEDRPDWELAETFFNSVTRRIFSTVGVDPRIEFVDTDYESPPVEASEQILRTLVGGRPTADIVRELIDGAGWNESRPASEVDVAVVARRVDERLESLGGISTIDKVDVVRSIFVRGKGAYIVGRAWAGSHTIPLVLAFHHGDGGIRCDAVLLTENQVSILFSFTRSYFHVDIPMPSALIRFLSTLMPRKRRAELYISIGHNKHGKTELYREMRRHLRFSADSFERARGTEGLVMQVFTLPGFDVVLKVIKDRFGPTKNFTRDHVLSRYRLVFRHDRAGRLVDAQEYEHLEFPKERFDAELLAALVETCGRTVAVEGDSVSIAHTYVERRVTPLDVFLAEASPAAAEAAVVDYGRCIKELAISGIFPGDMLLKNFGVTRHGRVVFYDYDELTTIDEPVFRPLPQAATIEDELAAEPWFAVGPHDVFPAEFATFLGLSAPLRAAFEAHHSDIFSHESWVHWQRQISAPGFIEIYPYDHRAQVGSGPRSSGDVAEHA